MRSDVEKNGEVTYRSVEKLLHLIAHKHQRRYGGNYDDLFSTANWAYLYAQRTHDPERGPLAKRIGYYVPHFLANEMQRQQQRREINVDTGDAMNALAGAPDRHHFDLDGLLGEVSSDAAVMIRTALDLPEKHIASKQRALVRFFRNTGWTLTRIFESFREIRDALR